MCDAYCESEIETVWGTISWIGNLDTAMNRWTVECTGLGLEHIRLTIGTVSTSMHCSCHLVRSAALVNK